MSVTLLSGVPVVDRRQAASNNNPETRRQSHDAAREVVRMRPATRGTNPCDGTVCWSPIKSLWFTAHATIAIVGGYLTIRWDAVVFSFVLTVFTLCLGHSIGLHRLLVHRSFECFRGVEYLLVHLGTAVGMGGPFRILYQHDIRDWAQRHPACHPFYIDERPFWRDLLWQLHCELRLTHPPRFVIEERVANDPVHQWLQRTWMLQQLPWAGLAWWMGGWPFVVWGISVRVTVSLIGHAVVGHLAHNYGRRDWQLEDHAVQGFNVPGISLLTMGEAWHNNHHAFPGSARLGLTASQLDPGWWALCAMRAMGVVWKLKLPEDLPARSELHARHAVAPITEAWAVCHRRVPCRRPSWHEPM